MEIPMTTELVSKLRRIGSLDTQPPVNDYSSCDDSCPILSPSSSSQDDMDESIFALCPPSSKVLVELLLGLNLNADIDAITSMISSIRVFLEPPVEFPFVCPPEMYMLPSGLLAIMDIDRSEEAVEKEFEEETVLSIVTEETLVVLPKKRSWLERFISFFVCGSKQ
jgi:hypothetical protein